MKPEEVRPALRCGIAVWDNEARAVRSCRGKATQVLVVRGDYLFTVCQRHEGRVSRAFPGMKDERKLGLYNRDITRYRA